MWECSNCCEQHGDQFDQCWRCGWDRYGTPPIEGLEDFHKLTDSDLDDLRLGGAPNKTVSLTDEPAAIQQPAALASLSKSPTYRQERPPPKPFLSRINTYFRRLEGTPIPRDNFQSQMPFWIASIQLILTPAKSTYQIRRLLRRIQRRVGRSRLQN